MFSTQTLKKVIIIPAAVVGLLVPLTACVAGEPAASKESVAEKTLRTTTDPGAGACRHVDAPMLDVPTGGDTEPRMRIPQPPGWEPTAELAGLEDLTRFALMTGDRADNGFPRNAVGVTVDRLPGNDAQAIFDDTRAALVTLLDERGWPTTHLQTTAGTVCGLPSQRLTYAGDPASGARPTTMLWIAVEVRGDTYLIGLTQTIAPNNPAYQRDAEMILSGFEVLPPASEL
jgi:hypothetical protein